jgi:hypothetical protein
VKNPHPPSPKKEKRQKFTEKSKEIPRKFSPIHKFVTMICYNIRCIIMDICPCGYPMLENAVRSSEHT